MKSDELKTSRPSVGWAERQKLENDAKAKFNCDGAFCGIKETRTIDNAGPSDKTSFRCVTKTSMRNRYLRSNSLAAKIAKCQGVEEAPNWSIKSNDHYNLPGNGDNCELFKETVVLAGSRLEWHFQHCIARLCYERCKLSLGGVRKMIKRAFPHLAFHILRLVDWLRVHKTQFPLNLSSLHVPSGPLTSRESQLDFVTLLHNWQHVNRSAVNYTRRIPEGLTDL